MYFEQRSDAWYAVAQFEDAYIEEGRTIGPYGSQSEAMRACAFYQWVNEIHCSGNYSAH